MMQSHRFLLISIITFIFINLPKSFSSTNNEQYTSCRNPFQCGTITATYPFWGNNRPSYCGQPGFQLNCTEGINTTSIQISSEIFHVLSIDNDTQFLKIARTDFFHGICPQKSLNTSLNFTLFDYTSSDQNLTLFYGCSNLTIAAPPVPNFTCSINGVISDVYVIGFGPIPVIDGLGKCNVSVLVPVLLSSFDALRSNESSLGEVLNQGFEVQWFMNKTFSRDCIESGGHCGYNWTSNEPICFCKDEAYLTICPASGNKSNLGRILAIGFSVGAVIILITCFLFFIYRRHIKKKYPSSTLRSRNISCNGTLKIDREKESKLFGAHIFTYTELEEATNNFDSSKELGDGGFGTVYHGKLKDGCEVAVKRLFEHNYKRVEQFMNEVEILTRLRHHNLVTLYGCTSHESRELLLVYEFIPNGTVADHLHGACRKAGLLKWPVRMNIAIESASAIAYLHATDIIHRDVKTTNILLDEKFSVKVADFGLSRLFPTDVTHVSTAPQGTPGYVDPEYYECYQLTDKSDVYSFGVVLIELISSKKAVDTNRNRHEINLASLANNKIRNRRLQELVDPCLGFETDFAVRKKIILVAELAFRCLQQEREIRPSMGEVLEVLRQINSEEYKVEKAEELDIREDDMGSHDDDVLPLSLITLSMNSVTDKWVSLPSTPNTSGSIILTSR